MAANYGACAFLALGAAINYFERNGFAIALTAASQTHGYPEKLKGDLMSYFYATYLSTHIVGGALARRHGGLLVLRRTTALWAAISFIQAFGPQDVRMLSLYRLAIGAAQGFVFPATHTLLGEMTEPRTRGRVVSLAVSSMYLGSSVSMIASPAIVGAMGPAAQTRAAAFLACGWLLGSTLVSWPDESGRIGRLETQARKASSYGAGGLGCGWATDIPWVGMAVHPAVRAMMLSSFVFHLVVFFLMSWTPTFVSAVLKEQLGSSGPIKAVPWLFMFGVAIAAGAASDAVAARVGVRRARKLICAAGLFGCVPMLVAMPYARTSTELFALSSLVLMTSGFSRGGWSINHLDIGPAFAGVLQGYSGTLGNLAGVVSTAVAGRMLSHDASDRDAWHQIFRLLAVLCVLAGLNFIMYAEGDVIFGEQSAQYHASGDGASSADEAPELQLELAAPHGARAGALALAPATREAESDALLERRRGAADSPGR
jgi:ACS family sodium-dependent inorganic phosphate cotransporter